MKTFRTLFLAVAFLSLVGSVVSFADAVKKENTEQAMNSVVLGSLAIAAPAVAGKEAFSALGMNGGFSLTRVEQHLLAYLQSVGQVSGQTYQDYITGKLKFINANFYVRKLITGLSGTQVILDQRDVAKTGLTNLDRGKLEQGVNAAIDRIMIGYATDAAIVDPINIKAYDSTVSNFPAGLRSAELILKQNGERLQDPIPATLCGSQQDSFMAVGKVDSYQLNTPIVLAENKQIVIELDLPIASFAANQHFVEIFLFGSKTKVRASN